MREMVMGTSLLGKPKNSEVTLCTRCPLTDCLQHNRGCLLQILRRARTDLIEKRLR